MIKKGQFLSPWDIGNVAEKVASTGNTKIILTERGAFVWIPEIWWWICALSDHAEDGLPVVYDVDAFRAASGAKATRAEGSPSLLNFSTRGRAAGVDGIFSGDTRQPRGQHWSDGPMPCRCRNSWPAHELKGLNSVVRRWSAAMSWETARRVQRSKRRPFKMCWRAGRILRESSGSVFACKGESSLAEWASPD